MGTSYPDRTNATGVWKLSDIYKNKITQTRKEYQTQKYLKFDMQI